MSLFVFGCYTARHAARFPRGLYSTLEEIKSVCFPPLLFPYQKCKMSPKLFIILAIVLDHRWSLSLHFVSCLVIWLICLQMLVMDDLLCIICTASIAKLGKVCRIQLVTQVSTVLSDDKCELFATTLSSFAHRPSNEDVSQVPANLLTLFMNDLCNMSNYQPGLLCLSTVPFGW